MSSLHDTLFGQCAAPVLMEHNGDTDTVSYTVNGTTTTGIVAIIGHAEVVETEGGDGTLRKVWRRSLHFMRDAASTWKGISDPQFKGQFLIKGKTWKLDHQSTIPIEGQSETMVTVNVTRKIANHKGQPNIREFS